MNGIALVLSRLEGVRRSGEGRWLAKCPGHDDRAPSLSVREGSSRILLHCFAGCDFSTIVAALRLKKSDLFEESKRRVSCLTSHLYHPSQVSHVSHQFETRETRRKPSVGEVEAALRDHLARIIAEETARLGYEPPIVSRHRNRARAGVNRLLGVRLRHVPPAWWEVWPHVEDPAWPIFTEYALEQVLRERDHVEPTLDDRNDAIDRAASWLHAEARREFGDAKTRKSAA